MAWMGILGFENVPQKKERRVWGSGVKGVMGSRVLSQGLILASFLLLQLLLLQLPLLQSLSRVSRLDHLPYVTIDSQFPFFNMFQ